MVGSLLPRCWPQIRASEELSSQSISYVLVRPMVFGLLIPFVNLVKFEMKFVSSSILSFRAISLVDCGAVGLAVYS